MKSQMCEFCYDKVREFYDGMPLCEKHVYMMKDYNKCSRQKIERTRKALRILCKAFDCSLRELGGYLLWKSGKWDVREYVSGIRK